MTASDERDAFERALAAHRRGDVADAAAAYESLLESAPHHADALHMLAMLRYQQGDRHQALALLDRALVEKETDTAMLANRASVHLALGDYAAAERDARAATRNDPKSFGAWCNLGLSLRKRGDLPEAATAFARASALRPGDARALLEWFSAAACSGQTFGIPERLRQPLPPLAGERDLALHVATDLEQHGCASAAFIILTTLRRELPQDAQVRERHEIETAYGAAALLEHQHRSDAALSAVDALLTRAPHHRGARMLRASLHSDRGETEIALDDYRRLVEQTPDDAVAGSAMLIAMQLVPACSAADIFTAHQNWAAQHTPRLAPPWAPRAPHADPERALRIGWISPRFCAGLLQTFFLGALRSFDRSRSKHFLYDNGGIEDAVTGDYRAAADAWRRVDAVDDAGLCDMIRADRIDVLVELSGHSPGNRLRALTDRPAPVQATWLDYFHSTGTSAIDVLLSDRVLSPPKFAGYYTERVLHLPSGRVCYSPPADMPPPLARTDGPIRFCSFNRVSKLNDAVLLCWSKILVETADSTLRLQARAFDDVDGRKDFLRRCSRHGISERQLELRGYESRNDALAAYAEVDIALDPFPFSGCATSLDALWMGVPVVTKIGETMVSRQTASVLTMLDLSDLIAETEEDYVQRALALAADSARRQELRNGLRERMRDRVCDSDKHASELESALRDAWRAWCGSHVVSVETR